MSSAGELLTATLRQNHVTQQLRGVSADLAATAAERERLRKSVARVFHKLDSSPELAAAARYVNYLDHQMDVLLKRVGAAVQSQERNAWTVRTLAGELHMSRVGATLLEAAGLPDLVAASDVVLTKPGYGIISECVANRAALLYTSRGRFREYDVLVAEAPRVTRCRYLAQDGLFNGRWGLAVDAVLAQPDPPECPPLHGADVAAGIVVDLLSR